MGIDSVVKAGPVIPVLQFQSVDEGVKVCRALYEGGIRTFEITMRTPVALEVIRALVKNGQYPLRGSVWLSVRCFR